MQVLASNRLTYETAAQRLIVSITPSPEGDPPYQGEFLVGNLNVEELLPEAVQEQFVQSASAVWEHDDVHIINITSALDRGGRVPLPIEGRKEGVYVKVGSHAAFSPCLMAVSSPESHVRCSQGQQPLAYCYDTFAPHFSIHWCNLTLVRAPLSPPHPQAVPDSDLSSPFQLHVLPTPTAPGPVWGPGVLEGSGDFQPPTTSPPQDLLPAFLVTLLVPLAVAAVLCVVLGHLMCCRREGV
ncbi:hypothetical protein CIB84_017317 [Bambusicola thoracicus]|uniref:Sarcoglycan alpha/epsilon second domain-containing protein n=1 Tax=Bambusicola thoracicus TaxID=9083 RepID=A0A2P4S465_BAMTH|nr:hypothetical protein CIB84_017317 [Bambusicola thoracicus]